MPGALNRYMPEFRETHIIHTRPHSIYCSLAPSELYVPADVEVPDASPPASTLETTFEKELVLGTETLCFLASSAKSFANMNKFYFNLPCKESICSIWHGLLQILSATRLIT